MSTTDTKTQTLDVAQDLIQRYGVNGMSFGDMSNVLGIRKASIHYHFPTKAELINGLLGRFNEQFGEAVRDLLRSRGSGKTKLKRFCELFLNMLRESDGQKNCLCGMLAAEKFSLEEDELALVRSFFSNSVDQIREILQLGIDDGSLRCRGSLRDTAEMILGTLEGGLLVARCHNDPKRFAGVIKRLLAYLTDE